MKEYIATFYSHFGAIRFHRELRAEGLSGELMPVPRDLSSSCGTAVRFFREDTAGEEVKTYDLHGEIEQIAERASGGYRICYRSENSG